MESQPPGDWPPEQNSPADRPFSKLREALEWDGCAQTTVQSGDAPSEGAVDTVRVEYIGGPLHGKQELVSQNEADALRWTDRVVDGVSYKLLRREGDTYCFQAHVRFDFGEDLGIFSDNADRHYWYCRCHNLYGWYALEGPNPPQYVVYYGLTYQFSHPQGIRMCYQRSLVLSVEVPDKFHFPAELPPHEQRRVEQERRRAAESRLRSSALGAAYAEEREAERARERARLDEAARLQPLFAELRREASAAVKGILKYDVHPDSWKESMAAENVDADSYEVHPVVHTTILDITVTWSHGTLLAGGSAIRTKADFGRVLERSPKQQQRP